MPFSFIHFHLYEQIQRFLNPDGKYNPTANAIAGAVAGGTAAFLTTPLDVVKTVLNTQESRIMSTLEPNCETCPVLEGINRQSHLFLLYSN